MNQLKNTASGSKIDPTVIVSGIVGLSELSAQLPPDEFTTLVNECFEF